MAQSQKKKMTDAGASVIYKEGRKFSNVQDVMKKLVRD